MSVESEETAPLIEDSIPDIPITAKDPKRVEQGKRLAAISKEAKERKMRDRIRKEEFSYLPWLGYTIAGLSSLGLVYLLMFQKESPKELEKTVIEKPPSPKKKKFESF